MYLFNKLSYRIKLQNELRLNSFLLKFQCVQHLPNILADNLRFKSTSITDIVRPYTITINYYYKERNIYKVTIYINRAANITKNTSREVRQDG